MKDHPPDIFNEFIPKTWHGYSQSYTVSGTEHILPTDRRCKPWPHIRKLGLQLTHNTWPCYLAELFRRARERMVADLFSNPPG